jgi:DNA polymerase III subunit gamma/tau
LAHLSLYRKYRSQTFGDLIGQDHVVRTIQNSIKSGRISHAYLFTGPRGTGKTSTARLLAKALCCEGGPTPEPDNTCDICISITAGNCMDVYEMDAASESGVDQVRETIVDVAEYRPTTARYKVFIIDEVHDLSPKAFDALLKTIEEPPAHVVFILATTEYNKVPPTIRSRCQKFEFHRGTVADLSSRLEYVVSQEGLEAEPAALSAISRMADGGYRDALTLLEQAMVTVDGPITLSHVYEQLGLIPEELVDGILLAVRECDPQKIMQLMEEAWRMGRDPRSVLESMEYRLGDLTRAAYGVDLGTTDATREASLHESASKIGKEALLGMRSAIAEAHRYIRDVSLPRLWLEAELIRIGRLLNAETAPVVVKPQAAPTQKPVAEARAVVKPETKHEPPKHPETKTNGEVAAAQKTSPPTERKPASKSNDVWTKAREILGGMSKTMAMKLDGTSSRTQGKVLVVEFHREFEHDWVVESPKRQAAILEQVRAVAGADWTVEYIVSAKSEVSVQPEAVELPVEGDRLEQLAKDILGAQ